MRFRKIDGTEIKAENYVKDYIIKHPKAEVIIGCDSQNKKLTTSYAIVIALYNPGCGAHVIFNRKKTKLEKVRAIRLINEVCFSLEIAEELKTYGINNIKYIDIDINPNPKYKSNEVFKQACGMVEGMGYNVRFKTLGPLVTTMADFLARH